MSNRQDHLHIGASEDRKDPTRALPEDQAEQPAPSADPAQAKRDTQTLHLEALWQKARLAPSGSVAPPKRGTGKHPRVRATSTDRDSIEPVAAHDEIADAPPGESEQPYYGHDDDYENAVEEV